MILRTARISIAVVLAAATLGGGLAVASPVEDKLAEANRIATEIETNGRRLTALAEERNRAQVSLDESARSLAVAEKNLATAEARAASLRDAVDGRAAQLMKKQAAGTVRGSDELDLAELETAAQRTKYAQITNARDRATMNKLAYVLEDLAAKRKAVAGIHAQRKADLATITRATEDLTKANEAQLRLLATVTEDIRKLMGDEAERQRSAARIATANGRGVVRDATPNPEPPSPQARIAITFAEAQLGKPYVYAAAGPDTFDCSGLTMRAYGAAGIAMLHYTGYQYRDFPRVPLDALLPGDLVFWGENAKDHVGLYIGGGLMIHAPHTGDVVRIAPVFGSPMGAVRPWL